MKKISSKNYIIFVILLALTVFFTLILSNIYLSKNKLVSEFYNNSNKITVDEIEGYITENPDAIIYISDKFDLTNESFEKKFEKKLDELNLKSKLVFIDKSELEENPNKGHKIKVDLDKTPIVIVIVDKTLNKIIYINDNTDVDNFMNFGDFE